MKYLKSLVIKNIHLLLFTLALATINQVASLLDPIIFRHIIDDYLTKVDSISKDTLIHGVLIMLGLSVLTVGISRLAKNFQDYFLNSLTQKIGAVLYEKVIQHSFALPFSEFEDQRSGELLSKIQKARSDVQQFLNTFISTVFFTLVGITFVLIYSFQVDYRVGLSYLIMIPLLGITTVQLSKSIKKAQSSIVKEAANLAGTTTETIRNVQLVKSLGLEKQEVKRLNNVNEELLQLELKKIKLTRTFSFIQGTLINLLRTSLLFLMYLLIIQKDLTLGEYFSLLFYSFFIFNPLSDFGNVAAQYQEMRASMENVEEIMKKRIEIKPTNPVIIDSLKSITFNKVSFNYDTDNIAISNINFKIERGKSYAFVGMSGAGKSTIIKLLVGLYKPTVGEITINTINSENIDWDSIRMRIGYVSQDTQVFSGSIKDNLLFVDPKASDNDCLKALKDAQALSIIAQHNEGLDTKIGEGGIKLSGGERQRLAIARALLRKPHMLIFDEATSSLDSMTEHEITKTIEVLKKEYSDLIIISIAHRLSTIMQSNIIMVLEKGSLIEQGTHQELLNDKGLYYALWRQQIGS